MGKCLLESHLQLPDSSRFGQPEILQRGELQPHGLRPSSRMEVPESTLYGGHRKVLLCVCPPSLHPGAAWGQVGSPYPSLPTRSAQRRRGQEVLGQLFISARPSSVGAVAVTAPPRSRCPCTPAGAERTFGARRRARICRPRSGGVQRSGRRSAWAPPVRPARRAAARPPSRRLSPRPSLREEGREGHQGLKRMLTLREESCAPPPTSPSPSDPTSDLRQ